jgi:hypothetical protein
MGSFAALQDYFLVYKAMNGEVSLFFHALSFKARSRATSTRARITKGKAPKSPTIKRTLGEP